ncbi:sigma-54-dependent Fis family transcriptional regulator, partial [Burkholderia gladioli]|nr:sigma-54-dependent Fis family transcriptional regulator [Burkholderia gladioli]
MRARSGDAPEIDLAHLPQDFWLVCPRQAGEPGREIAEAPPAGSLAEHVAIMLDAHQAALIDGTLARHHGYISAS